MPTDRDSTDRTAASTATTDATAGDDRTRIAFMCVRNAGRSQMATAIAERERTRRGLTDSVAIVTGGTQPADSVHSEVIDVMTEIGIDLSNRTPREITIEELRSCDIVATMGCSTLDVGELGADADVTVRDWALPDPDGQDLDRVRAIREKIADRVDDVFNAIDSEADTGHTDDAMDTDSTTADTR